MCRRSIRRESVTNSLLLRTVLVLIIRLGVVTAPTELVCIIGWLAMTVYLSVLEAENDVILAMPGHTTFWYERRDVL